MWILIVLAAVLVTAAVSFYVQRRLLARTAAPRQPVAVSAAAEELPDALPELGAVTFVLYQDNGGVYYWTIVDDLGEVVARSVGFASYADANFAADIVHRAAANATFEDRSGTSAPPPNSPSADAPAPTDAADEEPPHQGGSVSREEVTRRARAAGAWPAGSSSTPGGPRR